MNDIVGRDQKDARIRTEFVRSNGLTFEVDKCGAGDRLAICLHGFPEHSFSWRYQLPMLADMGFEAWAPNLRGYGKSSRPSAVSDYSLDKLVADVDGLMAASGHKDVVLIAHDWGAVIAWQFAMKKIRPLTHLVICNVPHPGAMREAMRNGVGQLRKSWYIFFFQIPWLPEFLLGRKQAQPVADLFYKSFVYKDMFPEEVREVYRKNASQPGALNAMINYYRSLIRQSGKLASQPLQVIETPTLMIWGEQDVALTKESTYGTDRYVSDFRIRYLPGVSHWVQQEAPQTVNAMIQAFLKDEVVPETEVVSAQDA